MQPKTTRKVRFTLRFLSWPPPFCSRLCCAATLYFVLSAQIPPVSPGHLYRLLVNKELSRLAAFTHEDFCAASKSSITCLPFLSWSASDSNVTVAPFLMSVPLYVTKSPISTCHDHAFRNRSRSPILPSSYFPTRPNLLLQPIPAFIAFPPSFRARHRRNLAGDYVLRCSDESP